MFYKQSEQKFKALLAEHMDACRNEIDALADHRFSCIAPEQLQLAQTNIADITKRYLTHFEVFLSSIVPKTEPCYYNAQIKRFKDKILNQKNIFDSGPCDLPPKLQKNEADLFQSYTKYAEYIWNLDTTEKIKKLLKKETLEKFTDAHKSIIENYPLPHEEISRLCTNFKKEFEQFARIEDAKIPNQRKIETNTIKMKEFFPKTFAQCFGKKANLEKQQELEALVQELLNAELL
jgi:hypothetical protein